MTRGLLWPKPQSSISSETFYRLDPENFQITLSEQASKCETLTAAVQRYRQLLFASDCSLLETNKERSAPRASLNNHPKYAGELSELSIGTGPDCPKYPTSNISEIYTIRVMYGDRQDAFLFGEEIWGVLRGLETFSQLIHRIDGNFVINSSFIVDYPRFKFRGLMVDTSRHFIPINYLLEMLDAMAYNKMNVLHWHIVDDQSFPYVSERYPSLSDRGAFTSNLVYSPNDVKKVLEYARLRGIRVLAEFDSPGHTLSWGKGIDNLLTQCYDKYYGSPTGTYGPVDPSRNETYDFLRNFLEEIVEVFPDEFIHLGGDEVDFSCWQSNPIINAFMKQIGISGQYNLLEGFYMQKVVDIVSNLQKRYIVWQEVFDNGVHLRKDAVIHVWKHYSGFDYLQEAAKITGAGYPTIISAPWYLNYISYGSDWKKYYSVELLAFNGTQAQMDLVLGGSACMWGEYVDATNFISRTW